MATNIEEIAEKLDGLTLLEAAQLSKLLQEKWGVSAAAVVLGACRCQRCVMRRALHSRGIHS